MRRGGAPAGEGGASRDADPGSPAARLASAIEAEGPSGARSKHDRQRAIRDLVASEPIGSQQELADRLIARGFAVTQATVSRDIGELGLVKVPGADGHLYVTPQTLAATTAAGARSAASADPGHPSDERLRRILSDIPVTVGRSGLVLLLTGSPGTASVIAQAIDESSLSEQEGTLAGDNTLLVLFADEPRLLRWRERFDRIRSTAAGASAVLVHS
jgi:transcriptional regulator of arginine metabolism